MTGKELYEAFCNRHLANGVYNAITLTWENCDEPLKQSYEDVAAMVSPSNTTPPPMDLKDMLVGLTQERRQELYKFLHNAFNCRMY